MIDELQLCTADEDNPKLSKQFTGKLLKSSVRARAMGITVVAATQKPEATVVDSRVRDLFYCRWAFNCATWQASDTILGANAASRGADASLIGRGRPGVGWLLTDDAPTLHRSYQLTHEDVGALATRAQKGQPCT